MLARITLAAAVPALALGLAVTAAAAGSAAERGRAVAERVDTANSGFATEVAVGELVLINAHGDRAVRDIAIQTREVRGDGDRSVVTFTSPPDVAGTKLLTWAHPEREDDQWLYMPAVSRVKRISGRNQSGSFMGSEFAYEDLSTPEVDEYTYRYIERRERDGHHVDVFARHPKDERSGYSREVVHVDSRYTYPVAVAYYNDRDELFKRAEYSEFERFGEYWRPSVVTMTNLQTDKRSRFEWHKRRLGVDLRDEVFRKGALGDW